MEKLVIDMGDFNLIVEKQHDVEFVVCFQDKKTDCITQDIAIIRRKNCDGELLQNSVECLVWTDDGDEDYTHKFLINQFLEVL